MGISVTMGYETVLYASLVEAYNYGRVADPPPPQKKLLLLWRVKPTTYLLTHSME
jgi:hypothetical protein